ncbi:MAG: hypothetical protein MUC73_08255 [Cyclobacteriaceae bacterium]|nr:hypothetical protein [Cyclobacteriaceae bacterium]
MKNIILILIAFAGVYLGDGMAQGTAPETLKKQMNLCPADGKEKLLSGNAMEAP